MITKMSTNSSAWFPAKLGALEEREFFLSNCRKALAFTLLDTNWVTYPGPANQYGLASPLLCPVPILLPGKILTLRSNRN